MNYKQTQAAVESPFDLLEEVKYALAITWNDEDKEIAKLIDRAVYAMNDLLGAKINLDVNLSARELVINRIRYEYNNALDEFEKNFHAELSRLILLVAIEERKKAEYDS